VTTEPIILDMASTVFDDQYEGCVKEMEQKALQMLKEDFNMSETFKAAWEEAEKHWKMKAGSYPGFNDFHGTALVTYTMKTIATDFNNATRKFTTNSSYRYYYRAFHYYLTRALQLLSNPNCYTVFRGTQIKFGYSGKGSVRFGQFTSTSLSKSEAERFLKRGGTLFVIDTCLGVEIKNFSKVPDEEEVLIPGYEVYH
ncbi:T-cell ecto-ADP-ribosyltransferase 1-like, partial [Nannospalax galili]|uniref:T-cell ecto-ADP-ribosyltransferase 1-like n=1 Tax=Nannospalax galili TaxID=1026970 RepID=UPI0004ED14E8